MTELLTAAQLRAIEAAAIASGEVTGLELMERAGRGVVEAIFEEWPELAKTSHRAVVLCGPGNNGGDGFVVARLLKEWGWEVEVFLYGDPEKLPPDASVNYERWLGMGAVGGWDAQAIGSAQASLFVDAVFGTGLTKPLPPEIAKPLLLLSTRNRTLVRTVSVDIPSGLCADSGRFLGSSRTIADLTVTFHRAKVGHHLAFGAQASGVLCRAAIGLPDDYMSVATTYICNSGYLGLSDVRELRHLRLYVEVDKGAFQREHKYSHGHALILSGPSGKGGAARLAARGALRIGAGLVTVGCPPDAIPENAARLDAVMLRPVADAAALAAVLEDRRINALCLGPGMGTGERARGLLAVALAVPDLIRDLSPDGGGPGAGAGTAEGGFPPPPAPPHEGEGRHDAPQRRTTGKAAEAKALPLPLVGRGEGRGAPRALVLDADALTILAQNPGLFAALHENCVLTPHAGEFARLFPDIAEKLAAPATKGPAYSKVDATREAAARAGCTVLYKGPDTVIADPSGRCAINSAHYERAAPWLATAGSGDVLAGFIAGLLARGFAPMQAAETAAWLHVECALKFGPGLIAEDLPEQLPAVFRDLGL